MAYTIKRHDLLPVFRAQLLQTNPLADLPDEEPFIPADLTGNTGVKFLLKTGSTLRVNGVATVEDAATGIVRYAWVAGDTDISGAYTAEFEVSWGALPQTFPSDSYLSITIIDDLG